LTRGIYLILCGLHGVFKTIGFLICDISLILLKIGGNGRIKVGGDS